MSSDGEPRTYGIFGFLAAFVVLGTVGLLAFLVLGNSRTPTVQLPAASTTAGPTTTEAADDGTAAPVTVPGGAPAPDGVTQVVSSGGVISYAFEAPATLAQTPVQAEVPPTTATPTAGGTGLDVTVTCAGTAGEVLAQLSVTETATSVTVLTVVLAPAGAPPCTGEVLRTVTVPLTSPLGARTVTVVPAGTPMPAPPPG